VGYFGVGFNRLAILKGAKWLIGCGLLKYGAGRNIDLLLASPEDGEATRGLASTYALLKIHPHSGAWLLHARRENKSPFTKGITSGQIKPLTFTINDRVIRSGQLCYLYKISSTLNIYGLRYKVQYIIDNDELEKRYHKERDALLKECGILLPSI